MLFRSLADQGGGLGLTSQIAAVERGFAPKAANLCGRSLRIIIDHPAMDGDIISSPGAGPHQRPSNPPRAARNQGCPARELGHLVEPTEIDVVQREEDDDKADNDD